VAGEARRRSSIAMRLRKVANVGDEEHCPAMLRCLKNNRM